MVAIKVLARPRRSPITPKINPARGPADEQQRGGHRPVPLHVVPAPPSSSSSARPRAKYEESLVEAVKHPAQRADDEHEPVVTRQLAIPGRCRRACQTGRLRGDVTHQGSPFRRRWFPTLIELSSHHKHPRHRGTLASPVISRHWHVRTGRNTGIASGTPPRGKKQVRGTRSHVVDGRQPPYNQPPARAG